MIFWCASACWCAFVANELTWLLLEDKELVDEKLLLPTTGILDRLAFPFRLCRVRWGWPDSGRGPGPSGLRLGLRPMRRWVLRGRVSLPGPVRFSWEREAFLAMRLWKVWTDLDRVGPAEPVAARCEAGKFIWAGSASNYAYAKIKF